jgi:hypothetical protein
MGLAGFYLLRDDDEDALGLPSGEFEVPLVIQDRSFDVNGQLKYTNGFTDHFFGEFVCVNGKVWPYMDVKRAKYRFRIVNGSSNRTYTLTMPRLLMFNNLYLNVTQQIGTDLGLLPAPVPITSLTIMPGERADIIVDFTSFAPNSTFTITNSALSPFPSGGIGPDVQNVMRFNVGSEQVFSSAIPSSLVAVPPIPTNTASNSRSFQLAKTFETECNHDVWLINSLGWDDLTDFPYLNSTEIWSFVNRSGISHPMHVHLVHFQVLDRQAFTVGAGDVIIPTGPVILPLPQERGWKDTVQATPNQITRVIMKFENFPGKFPFHCHILDHEDHEMMRLFQAICRPIRTGGEPTDLVFLPGETVTLNAVMDGDMLEYQWFNEMSPVILQDGDTSDGSIVYGVTTSQLTFLNFQPGLQGIFRARAVDPCGHSEVSLPARVLFHLCIADVDDSTGTGVPDGGVGIEDLLYYLQVYDAGTSRGDVDDGAGTGQRDGGVGIEDLLFYLERYDAGC